MDPCVSVSSSLGTLRGLHVTKCVEGAIFCLKHHPPQQPPQQKSGIAPNVFTKGDEFLFVEEGRGMGGKDTSQKKYPAFLHPRYLSQANSPQKRNIQRQALSRICTRRAVEVCCLSQMRSWCPATLFTMWTLPSMTPRLLLLWLINQPPPNVPPQK